MNAIPMAEFQKLSSAMSRCKISIPEGGVSFILDRTNEKVGEINWHTVSISIYDDYEYCDEVLQRLGRFTDVGGEFESDRQALDEDMELTDYGKKLYEQPTTINLEEIL